MIQNVICVKLNNSLYDLTESKHEDSPVLNAIVKVFSLINYSFINIFFLNRTCDALRLYFVTETLIRKNNNNK